MPNTPIPKLDVRVDGKRVKLLDVNINTAEEAQDSRNYEVRMPMAAGIRSSRRGIFERIREDGRSCRRLDAGARRLR